MRYIFTAGLTLFTVIAVFAEPPTAVETPVLTIHVAGDVVDWDEDDRQLHVRGNVRILGYTTAPDSPRLGIRAREVHADLAAGIIRAHGSVRMRSDEGAFRGEDLYYNLEEDVMRLTDAAVNIQTPTPDGRTMRGFFFADEIERTGADRYVIINGIATPADSPEDVQVGAGADRLVFNAKTNEMTVYNASVYFEGFDLGIPLPSGFSFTIGGGEEDPEKTEFGWPSYSSLDGVYWPFYHTFTGDDEWLRGRYELHLGMERYLTGVTRWTRERPEYDFGIYLSREEYVPAEIDDDLLVSRIPEVSYTRHWEPDDPDTAFDTGVSIGRFHEKIDEDDAPSLTEKRAAIFAGYSDGLTAEESRVGQWWGIGAEQSFYGNGTRFRDLSIRAGAGTNIGEGVVTSLTAIRHFPSGIPTLEMDNIDIERELYGTFEWQMSEDWSLFADGNYDLQRESLRDYTVGFSRRSDYLTYTLDYDFSAESIGFRIDVNGLTGGTAPPETEPVVTEDEIMLTPEWVHQEKSGQM